MKTICLLAILAATSLASAAVLQDFESGYAGPGVMVADPDDPANTVLKLANVPGLNDAEVCSIPVPAGTVSVSMRIYDFGANTDKTMNHYGPRWGLLGDGSGATGQDMSGFNMLYASVVSGYKGYTANGPQDLPMSPTSALVSVYWVPGFSTSGRYAKALDDAATPEFEGQGAWTTWTFAITPDALAVTAETNDLFQGTNINGAGTYTSGPLSHTGEIAGVGVPNMVFISAGSNHASPAGDIKFVGCLVDDITYVVPEPASMSMLALGGLALLRRRK